MGRHMEPTAPTEFYAQAGRNRTIHRGVVTSEGVRVIGSERCNLDQTVFPPTEVPVRTHDTDAHFCGWCFPSAAGR